MKTTDRGVMVIGAGLMGTGIAHAFLAAGCQVQVADPQAAARDKARRAIERILDDGVARGKMAADAADAAKGRLLLLSTPSEFEGECSLAVETAVEDLAVKQDIIRTVEARVGDSVVIATNTSALSITEIAAAARCPRRVIGMHFFNPVQKMKLVEIVRGLETDDESLAAVQEWSAAIGKTSIVVNEAPGFTTSRISALLGNEAMTMLHEGVASAEDIDTSLRMAFNHPMGPLELGDLTGWDTRLKVLQYLHQTLGEKFRPCPLIIKMVKAGRTGRKAGRGVYEYDAEGNRIPGSGLRAR
jgi:3-hydroxybutyryl-CoA dehydrogenase